MREIVFRAKDYETKQWVYGIPFRNPVYGLDSGAYYPQIIPEVNKMHSTVDRCSVIEETIGQYTGLTDKNGVKIFEGDIVRVNYNDSDGEDYEDVVLVAYDGKSGGFSPYTWNYSCDGCDCGVYVYSVEVIGNIYDNPELLGGADDD